MHRIHRSRLIGQALGMVAVGVVLLVGCETDTTLPTEDRKPPRAPAPTRSIDWSSFIGSTGADSRALSWRAPRDTVIVRLRSANGEFRELAVPLAALSTEAKEALNDLVRSSRERRQQPPTPVSGVYLTPPSADTLYEDGHTYVWAISTTSTEKQTERRIDGATSDIVVEHLENAAVYGTTALSYAAGSIQSSTYIPETEVQSTSGDPGPPPEPETAGENCGEYISKAIVAWVNHIKAIREHHEDPGYLSKIKMITTGAMAIGWTMAAIAECEL